MLSTRQESENILVMVFLSTEAKYIVKIRPESIIVLMMWNLNLLPN